MANPSRTPGSDRSASTAQDKLFSGSLFVFLGLMLRIALLLLFELVAARHLGPASYGVFSLAFTVVVVTSHMPVLGLQNSLRRFISYHLTRGETEEARGLVVFGLIWPAALGVLLAIGLFVAAERLCTDVFGKPDMAPLLRVLALVVPLWATRRLATVIFSGYVRPSYKVALEDFLEPFLRVTAAAVVAFSGWGALQLGYATLGAYLIVGPVAWALVLRGGRQVLGSGTGLRLRWRELQRFSTPLVVSEFADIILAWVGVILLGILSTDTEVGLFRSASQPPMLASAMLTSFSFVFLPMATGFFVRQDRAAWKRANNAVARSTLSLAFPVGVLCILFPGELIDLLFGSEYHDGAVAMRLLGASSLLHAGCGFTGLNLMIAGHTRLQMAGGLLALLSNLAASLLWIPAYGAAGAAGAVLLSVALRNAFNLVFMGIRLRLHPFSWRYLGLLGAHLTSVALLMGAVHVLGLARVAGMLVVVGLELPLAIGIAFLLGIVRASDAEMIARFRGAREDPRR